MTEFNQRLRRRSSALVGDSDAYDYCMPRPFTYSGETFLNSRRELFKVLISFILLIPVIRFIIALLCFVIQWMILELITLGRKPVYDKNGVVDPLTGWRRKLLDISCPLLSRIVLICFGIWKVKTRGEIDPSTRIVVVNHVTILDAFLLMSQFQFIAVAKKEAEKTPLVGRICSALQFIFVDRGSVDGRADVLSEIGKRVHHGGFPPILVFPEGTTSNGNTLIRFKKGAFSTGYPVQAVLIKFPWEHSNPCWTNHSPPLWVALTEMLCQPFQRAEVVFLPVRRPSKGELADPARYAENVRKTMAQAMNVPIVPYGVEDSIVESWLLRRGEGVEIGVSVYELKERFKVKLEQIKRLIEDFDRIDSKGDRLIDREEFWKFMAELNPTIDAEFANRVFVSFDANESSLIDYREFIIGCLTLNDNDDLSNEPVFSFEDVLHRSRLSNSN